MKIYSKLLIGVLITTSCEAYETPTHAFITKTGFDRSLLTVNADEIFPRLGFDRLDVFNPFKGTSPFTCTGIEATQTLAADDVYVDATAPWLVGTNTAPNSSNVFFRCPRNYERLEMPPAYSGRSFILPAPASLGPTPQLRFEAWLMRGVIREDDVANRFYSSDIRPDIDPWEDRTRVFNHFYSPITNSPDSPITSANGGPALHWAMGEVNPFADSQLPDPTRGNHFSYMDARRAFYFALTYKQNPSSPDKAFEDSRVRMALWATTLKSLGHVVHLLQDQASPQHSRGEPHNHVCKGLGTVINQDLATRSYENFINFRLVSTYNTVVSTKYVATNDCEEAKWLKLFQSAGQETPEPIDQWTLNVYPTPQFSLQREFFTTRAASDPVEPLLIPLSTLNARRGLGDYANRGFYTQDNQAGSYRSPPAPNSPEFIRGASGVTFIPGRGNVRTAQLLWAVPDALQPGFADQGLINGRAPIISRSIWCELSGIFLCTNKNTVLSLQNYSQMADMLIPRAIAYTTGLINFFFRGKLEIEPITQRVFGVMNQGEPHTVNADGYPIRTSNGKIFGFEKIRLKIRNSTNVITESGTNQVVPQVVGVGKLVAVARYHRNPCYKPDLSGERAVGFVEPPLAVTINEPVCPQGLRTNYQEISVSAPLQINSAADLPGGSGGAAPATLEKLFDFSADPIPINATDLFIQVVYRGQLGEETDGIAVGIVDVQEPTITGAWNNTDYFYSDLSQLWFAANGAVPARGIDQFNICTGSGANSVLVFRYITSDGMGGLQFFLPTLAPGIARLAFINAKQLNASNQNVYRVTPQVLPPVTPPPSLLPRSYFSKGQQRQASREIYTAADPLPAPSYCQAFPPAAGSNVWCFDPVQRRRGQLMGDAFTPIFYNSQTGVGNAPDVDKPPAQPVFPGLRPRAGGAVLFDVDSPLLPCPNPLPAAEGKRLELIEAAMELGVDPSTLRLD